MTATEAADVAAINTEPLVRARGRTFHGPVNVGTRPPQGRRYG